jgi:hypothetical protein
MKTNVILNSTDRELFGIKIRQNTEKEFLSVTDLQQAYENARFKFGWSDRRISDILQGKITQERIFYLLESQGIIKTELSAFIESIENQGITKVLKNTGVWKATGARGTNQVMCHPYIWVLLAMELNPMIYAKVVIWLTDSLIFNRIEAGDEYAPMNSAIKKIIPNPNYSKIAIEINKRVFTTHVSGIRNLASAKELRKIADIEKLVTNSIELGFVKTEDDIIRVISMAR